VNLEEISNIRLSRQQITGKKFQTPTEVVGWMGAMQAQDYTMAKWAVGVRLINKTEKDIESSIDRGEIIRAHLMRPTWHFVTAEDYLWMLELTAPQIRTSMKARQVHLELNQVVIKQSNDLLVKAMRGGKHLTREEIAREYKNAKIKTSDNRLAHLLIYAELDGVVCSGKTVKGKPTYALLQDRIHHKKVYPREESLYMLARKYFTSHGPATLKDFTWWSGLTVKDAKQGLDSVKKEFNHEEIESETYWFSDQISNVAIKTNTVCLLPAYDEFLIGYKDRSASLTTVYNKNTISSNGIFRPLLVINGQVSGVWRRLTRKDYIELEISTFLPVKKEKSKQIKEVSGLVAKFFQKESEVTFLNE
jgi:Winged helix DNA-binding domain